MGRKTYTDKARANAVLMLEAAGYKGDRETNTPGALARVSKHLGIPVPTLSRWFRQVNNPPPTELVTEKRLDLLELIEGELQAIFQEMPTARPDADYRTLGTVAGILADKRQLLSGGATQNQDIHIRFNWNNADD